MDSIIGQISPPVGWDPQAIAAYEAAIEAINAAVGAYSARIAAEEAKAEPDREAIRCWEAAQAGCATARLELDPDNSEQIAAIRSRYSALARTVADL